MNAFAGVVFLDGRAARPEIARAMIERLWHRVGVPLHEFNLHAHVWNQGEAVLANAGIEVKALSSSPGAGDWWLAGQIRLDNRRELGERLRLPESQLARVSDAALVAQMLACFGDETPALLRGDWAFGAWNARQKQLLCARDALGVRPFYFAHRENRAFAFASELKALWALDELDARVKESAASAFLLQRYESHTSTFYQGIERLPPATTLWLDARNQTRRERRFWEPNAQAELRANDDECARRVREVFELSVQQRTHGKEKVGAFLSGGLDSSSVAAVAARVAPEHMPMPALSMVFDRFPTCDEREWIGHNLDFASGKLDALWIRGDNTSALHNIERVVWHLDGPPPGPNTCATWTQYAPLRQHDCRVVLDGHGGDEVVFLGYERIGELLRAANWKAALHELRLLKRHELFDAPIAPVFGNALKWHAHQKRGLGRAMGWLTRRNSSAASENNTDMDALALQLLHPDRRAQLPPLPFQKPARNVREEHLRALNNPLQAHALEAMDAMAGAWGTQVRVPFWQQELVELCLSLPSDQKLRDGWNRWVMRRAMQGIVAPEVLARPGKTDFAPQMIFGLSELERERLNTFFAEATRREIAAYVDVPRVRALWNELKNLPESPLGTSPRAAVLTFALWRVAALDAWLENATKKQTSSPPQH